MKIKTRVLSLAILLGLFAFVLQSFVDKEHIENDKYIGLQLYSVRTDMKKDPKGTVAKVGEMGYKFVEAAGYGNGKFYGMKPENFKDLCEDNGLAFLGSHAGKDLPDEDDWERTMKWWDKAIDAHAKAGVKWIVQPWMSKEGYESLDGLKNYMKYFNAVGEKCNAKGIKFGYHNHDKEFTTEFEGKAVYDWMLELSDPDKVMFELDLFWINRGGKDALKYFDQYPGRFMLWHIKDEKELGASGTMDFEAIFSQKSKAGLEYGIVEVEEYSYEPLESCKKSYEYLMTTNY